MHIKFYLRTFSSMYLPVCILVLIFCMVPISPFDYAIPQYKVQYKKSQIEHKINYYKGEPGKYGPIQTPNGNRTVMAGNPHFHQQSKSEDFNIKDDIVRVRLGGNGFVYSAHIVEYLDDVQNQMCDIVKSYPQPNNFDKYLLYYALPNPSQQNFLLSTTHFTNLSYTLYKSHSPSMGYPLDSSILQNKIFAQYSQNLTIYSLTSTLQIHQNIIQSRHAELELVNKEQSIQSGTFGGKINYMSTGEYNVRERVKKNRVFKWDGSQDFGQFCGNVNPHIQKFNIHNSKYIQLLKINKTVILKCVSQNQRLKDGVLNFYPIQFHNRNGDKKDNKDSSSVWTISNSSRISTPFPNLDIQQDIEIKQIRMRDPSGFNQDLEIIVLRIKSMLLYLTQRNQKIVFAMFTIYDPFSLVSSYHTNANPVYNFVTIFPAVINSPYNLSSYSSSSSQLQVPSPFLFLFAIEKNYGLLVFEMQPSPQNNLEKKGFKLVAREDFNGLIQFEDVEMILYSNKERTWGGEKLNQTQSQNKRQNRKILSTGVLQIVLLQGKLSNKQHVIQIFHEIQQKKQNEGLNKHLFHINKIYHNYHTNNPSSSLSSSPNKIHKILPLQLPPLASPLSTGNSHSLGILQSSNKLTTFQYSIPRTFSPSITRSSQLVSQSTHSGILSISSIDYPSPVVLPSPTATSQLSIIQSYLISYPHIQQYKNNQKYTDIVKYIYTGASDVRVVGIDGQHLWQYQYVCNMNNMGSQANQIGGVRIVMEKICQLDNQDEKQGQAQLGYCQQELQLKFLINSSSVQSQKDSFLHTLVVVIILSILSINAIIVIVFWQNIKLKLQKLVKIREDRRKMLEFTRMGRTPNQVSIDTGKMQNFVIV